MSETARPIGPANKAVAVLLAILAAAATFFLFEGLASCLLIVDRLVLHPEPVLKERSHCGYDDVLGWVQLPHLDIADQYGPGVFLRTNARGFRGSREVDVDVPAGRTRVVCSGDSFTLGYGVNDDQAWCQVLTALDPRRETVNMGQGGYGADQAYLWYRRDGQPLAHQAHVFALDTVELERMRRDEFLGYGRPVLRLVGDALTVTNTPIPRRGYALPWLTQNATSLTELRSMQLLLKVAHRISPPVAGRSTADIRAVSARMLADLHAINERKSSRLLLVYLPIPTDYDEGDSEPWRRWLAAEAARQHIPYVDLVETLRRMPESGWRELFDPKTGHYSVQGNHRVAQLIAEQLDGVVGSESSAR